MLFRNGLSWFLNPCVSEKTDKSEKPVFTGTKILCVGRNYRKHAAELGNEVPETPLWFSKPPSSIIGEGQTVVIPESAGRIDFEGELALIIGTTAKNVRPDEAEKYIAAVTACFDITARELQKQDGQWTRAKGFDTFLPIADYAVEYTPEWKQGSLEVKKNNQIVQKDSFASMVFGFSHLISHISACMTLEPGDLILTGTPDGVGPISTGDRLSIVVCAGQEVVLSVNCA